MELFSAITVRVNRADTTGTSLLVSFGLGQKPLRFRSVGAGLLQEVGATGLICFDVGKPGQPDRLFMGSVWMAERMNWYQTLGVQFGIAVVSVLVLLSAAIAWSAAALRRKREDLAPRELKHARWLAGVVSALYLIVLASLVVVLKDPMMKLAFGVPKYSGPRKLDRKKRVRKLYISAWDRHAEPPHQLSRHRSCLRCFGKRSPLAS